MSKSVVYKFGQKKTLEKKYGSPVLQFRTQRKTLLNVKENIPTSEIIFKTKGEHPDALKTKKKKSLEKERVKKTSPAKKIVKAPSPEKEVVKKKSPAKKILKAPSPTKKISPENERVKKKSPAKKILKAPSPAKKKLLEKERLKVPSSPKKKSPEKVSPKKTKKITNVVEIETEKETKPNLPTSKDKFIPRDKIYEEKVVEIIFPKTKTLLVPSEKNIKIQKDQSLEPVEDLEKRKLVRETRINILKNLDARKLDGFMEGKRKNKYTKGELLKIAQQLGLPVKNSETRGSFVEKIKNAYIKNEIPMKLIK
jgi:hypothetical protein